MSRRRALAIVERAYRGAAEQQYAHVLWLVRSLHGAFDMTVWLRGAAALYALPHEAPPELEIGGVAVCTPDYEATVRRLVDAGSAVYVSGGSLEALGLAELELIGGIHRAEDSELGALCAAHDHVWFL